MTRGPDTSGGVDVRLVGAIRVGYRTLRAVGIALAVVVAGWAAGVVAGFLAFALAGPHDLGAIGQGAMGYLAAGARAGTAAGAVALIAGVLLWRSARVRSGLGQLQRAVRVALAQERGDDGAVVGPGASG